MRIPWCTGDRRTRDIGVLSIAIITICSGSEGQGRGTPTWRRVAKDGQMLYFISFGVADIEKGRPVTPDIAFGLASVTKSFTALALNRLTESGVGQESEIFRGCRPSRQRRGKCLEGLTPSGLCGVARSAYNTFKGCIDFNAMQKGVAPWNSLR